jgi:staphylococcal nuclease domain-containing protein 1
VLGSSLVLCKPWAYEAREFLRALTVGKEIAFTSSHQLPPGEGDTSRDLGNGEVNGVDITNELLLNGWAKVKESKREPTEDDLRRKGLESEAKSAGRGQWNPHGPKVSRLFGLESGVHLCFFLGAAGRTQHALRFSRVHQ